MAADRAGSRSEANCLGPRAPRAEPEDLGRGHAQRGGWETALGALGGLQNLGLHMVAPCATFENGSSKPAIHDGKSSAL